MSVTPRRRVIRTIVQVVLGVCLAIPATVALLPISAATAAAVTGIGGAFAIVVSAAWNAYDAAGGDV